jgi:lanthanide-dependent methanol dehydrogenase
MRTTVLFLAIVAGACGWVDARHRASGFSAGPTASAGGVIPAPDDSTDWTRPARDYASTRFSSLDQITRDSVRQLGVKATFSTGYVRGHEAAPLVVNNTMYVVTPFPNVLYALDLTKPGIPVTWKFDPKTLAAAQGVACCDVVNRGAVYTNGTSFFNTLDARTVAVNAETGAARWIVSLGDINKGETITMAPLVVKDKVLVGNSGGEMGVRGWLTALRIDSGSIAWRAYHTGPDKDVLIGPRFKPIYAHNRGTDLGIHTWPGEAWKQGGGTAWGWISSDPALNAIYYGTGIPACGTQNSVPATTNGRRASSHATPPNDTRPVV